MAEIENIENMETDDPEDLKDCSFSGLFANGDVFGGYRSIVFELGTPADVLYPTKDSYVAYCP